MTKPHRMGPDGLTVQGGCRVTAALANQRGRVVLLLGSWHPREPHPVGIFTVRRLIAAETKKLEGVTLSSTLKELLVPRSPEVHLPSLNIGVTTKYGLTARSSFLLHRERLPSSLEIPPGLEDPVPSSQPAFHKSVLHLGTKDPGLVQLMVPKLQTS